VAQSPRLHAHRRFSHAGSFCSRWHPWLVTSNRISPGSAPSPCQRSRKPEPLEHIVLETGHGTDPAPSFPQSRGLPLWNHKHPHEEKRNTGKIVVTTNVSLDGVVQDPDGREGFRHGGWFAQFGGKDLEAWAAVETNEALTSEAILLSRKGDECFATLWLSRTGEWADRLNSLPKYVVSSTLEEPKWSNSTVLRDDIVKEISTLKEQIDGDFIVYASFQLVRALIEEGLVDEFRLVIFPVVLGAGERPFGDTSDTTPLRLVHTQTVGEGLPLLTYEVVRDAS